MFLSWVENVQENWIEMRIPGTKKSNNESEGRMKILSCEKELKVQENEKNSDISLPTKAQATHRAATNTQCLVWR